MKLNELYEYFECNWTRVARETGFGLTTLTLWRKKGEIPQRAQLIIERRLGGAFKADK